MKKLFLGLLITTTTFVSAQHISDSLVAVLKTGNTTKLANYFEKSIDLSIPENEGVYSKTQAKLVLKKFFLKNKPSDFKIVHSGNSKNNSHYAIGNLKSSNGLYRTYILYKELNKKIIILELKIELNE
ncbi:MAG: DUF4783 domain-containing protein [Vicingaceae bacterium]